MYWILLLLFFPTTTFAEHTETRFDLTSIPPLHEATLLVRRDVPTSFTSRVISREQWGADESFLFQKGKTQSPENIREVVRKEPSDREEECDAMQKDFQHEFTVARSVPNDFSGRRYRWAQQYSKEIKLLVVHHTALEVNGETRTEEERVRALYTYHANNLGWGDIGYNFVIGESGRIYEGRTGGEYVVGGHAYCYNVGSIGIALLGNFEQERPTQEQIQGLQWLLDHLSKKYGMRPNGQVQFHGKNLPTIVGHNDLNKTVCPGYFLDGVLPQIRAHLVQGNLTAMVNFPSTRIAKNIVRQTTVRKNTRQGSTPESAEPLRYSRRTNRSRRIVARAIERATRGKNSDRRVMVPAGRSPRPSEPWRSGLGEGWSPSNHVARDTAASKTQDERQMIRIRLSYFAQAATIAAPHIGEVVLKKEGNACNIPMVDGGREVLTMTSWTQSANQFRGAIECHIIDGKITLVNTLPLEEYLKGLAEEPDTEPYEKQRAFAIAARSYAAFYTERLHHPSSNPSDTTGHRKFPGMPYDGSDDPKEFQAYGGVTFERQNPQWVQAVQNTASQVLTKNGDIVKAAYFSTDDGRTRSPEERGWANFPFPEVFRSKPDPWCQGLPLRGHGVGMSGCGAERQAKEGRTAEEILQYYYPGTVLEELGKSF